MKVCPECGAQNPDETAFCGNCGTKLDDTTGKKTMFGFAAVSDDELEKAVADAKEKGQEARGEEQPEDGGESPESSDQKKPASGLKLPRPGLPRPPSDSSTEEKGDGPLSIPKPGDASRDTGESGLASDSRLPSPGNEPEPAGPGDVSPDAKTEVMNAVPGPPEPSAGTTAPAAADDWGAPESTDDASGTDWGAPEQELGASESNIEDAPHLGDPLAPETPEIDTLPDVSPTPPPTNPEVQGPPVATADSSWEMGEQVLPQGAPGGPLENVGPGEPGEWSGVQTEGDSKNKTLVYIAIGAAAALLLCCIVSLIASFIIG